MQRAHSFFHALTRLNTDSPRLSTLLKSTLLVGIYFYTGRFGLKLNAVSGFATLIWIPTGISLASLLIFGRKLWLGVAIGAFLVNRSIGASWQVALGIGLGNTLEAVMGTLLLERARFICSLERLHDVLNFILLGAFLATTVSATIGVMSLWLGEVIESAVIWETWIAWWIGDILGALIVAPVILIFCCLPRRQWSFKKLVELLLFYFALILVSLLTFTDFIGRLLPDYPLAFVVFPILIWASIRFGVRESSIGVLIVSVIATWGTSENIGPFSTGTLSERLLLLQGFMSVVSVTSLVLSSIVAERAETMERTDFLSRSSSKLAGSIDLQDTLRTIMETAVPYLADWCVLEVSLSGDEIYRMNSKPISHPRGRGWISIDLGPPVFASLQIRENLLGILTLRSYPSIHQKKIMENKWIVEEFARRAVAAIDNAYLYDQVRRSLDLRDEFISIASHELRTPITPLKVQLQLIKRHFFEIDRLGHPNTRKRLFELLSSSEQQINRMSRVIENMLTVSRITVGTFFLNRTTVDLTLLVKEAIKRYFSESKQEGLDVTIVAEAKVIGNWDTLQIEEVVITLLTNAIKYGLGKPILIHTFQVEKDAIISVQDQGVGIPRQDQVRIFNRFERLQSIKNIGGLGLGLYIAQEIVKAHGGAICLTSEPGKGSTFVVKLPTG